MSTRSARPVSSGRKQWVRSRLLGDETGATAILVALALPVMVGAAGLAVDVGTWFDQRARIQIAADSAALAGAHALAQGGTTSQVTTAAQTAAAQNGFTVGGATAVSLSIASQAVTATVSSQAPLIFSALYVTKPVSISAAAGASYSGQPFCMLALDPTASSGIGESGNGAIVANGCGVQVDSSSSTALTDKGNGSITAQSICVTGGYTGSSFTPTPQTSCPAQPDPLASTAPPSYGACTYNNVKIHKDTTLTQGVYCGGITIDSQSNVTFSPGIYVIENGGLTVSGGSTIYGNGVGFYLTGTGPSVDLSGAGAVHLSAPTSGPMAGLIFFGDRSVTGVTSKLVGGSSTYLEGTIYLPDQNVLLAGNATGSSTAPFTALIADTVTVTGSGTFTFNSNYSSSSVPVSPNLTVKTVTLTQ